MLKHKLPRVHDRPQYIFEAATTVLLLGQILSGFLEFARRWLAAERGKVKILDNDLIAVLGLDQFANAVIVRLYLAPDCWPIE